MAHILISDITDISSLYIYVYICIYIYMYIYICIYIYVYIYICIYIYYSIYTYICTYIYTPYICTIHAYNITVCVYTNHQMPFNRTICRILFPRVCKGTWRTIGPWAWTLSMTPTHCATQDVVRTVAVRHTPHSAKQSKCQIIWKIITLQTTLSTWCKHIQCANSYTYLAAYEPWRRLQNRIKTVRHHVRQIYKHNHFPA